MRILGAIAVGAFLSATPALADQTDLRLDGLFAELQAAEEHEAPSIEARIWEIWAEPQSATTAVLMERTEAALEIGDLDLARELSGHITGIAPSFAEGWHLRARVLFALDRHEEALAPLERAVALEPRHFGAYYALAALLDSLGQRKAAFEASSEALTYNPHYEDARRLADRLREAAQGRGI